MLCYAVEYGLSVHVQYMPHCWKSGCPSLFVCLSGMYLFSVLTTRIFHVCAGQPAAHPGEEDRLPHSRRRRVSTVWTKESQSTKSKKEGRDPQIKGFTRTHTCIAIAKIWGHS